MCIEKGGGCASNPLQLRIFSMCYGSHTMSPEGIFEIGLKLSSKAFRGTAVNPVRKSLIFQRGGSHRALNPVFALKGIISSSSLQAAGLSNGVKVFQHTHLPFHTIFMQLSGRILCLI
jgi:hypothetical protein